MKDFSYITNSHPAFIESLYQDFINDPNSIDPELKRFFEGFDFAVSSYKNGMAQNGFNGTPLPAQSTEQISKAGETSEWKKELGAYRMILGYRNKGHLIAKTNPIRPRKDRGANLDLGCYGFTEEDLDKKLNVGASIGLGTTTLRAIVDHLQKIYAAHVGIEFKYISDQKIVDWLTNEMEKNFLSPFPLEKKKRVLEKLNQGVMFEKFLHTK
jgi:2-oxoglutarate dehydrogenase E1 component